MEVVSPILSKREFVNMPDEEYIMLGIRDIMEDAIDGTGIFDKSEQALSFAEVRQNLLKKSNLKAEQIPLIMQPVIQMNKTQLAVEMAMKAIKRSNEDTEVKRKDLYIERQKYVDELNNMLK